MDTILRKIGIDIIGITKNYDIDKIYKRLVKRREKNYHTEFEFDINKRLDIESILPGWKNIISIGISYNFNIESIDAELKGRVSKSAIGRDYHLILNEKMDALIKALNEEGYEFNYFKGVDTTPLVDREIAAEAGIGFFGKNNSIINEEYGSFIFLGFIIIDIDISELWGKNRILENRCINCNLCIKSCPTNALRDNNDMDAKRCLSYLTQTKEDIPFDLREKINTLYGCDICQNVCPYNRNAIKKDEKEIIDIDLEDIIFISNKEFKRKYGDKAFSWRGKNIIRRNAVILLSKIVNKKSKDILIELLKDSSEMIRKYSIWALYMHGYLDLEAIILKASGRYLEENINELKRIEEFYVIKKGNR
ncbi:MAG: tRNA epoxyqueuosine(34) reductase QueG [Andreesenia angusta]|nr:tRNA epoxyqueuosine(34) reductase QueG [Andreesenia angusta]